MLDGHVDTYLAPFLSSHSVVRRRPFDLLVFPFWSTFSGGPKRLTFYFQVLWASEHKDEYRRPPQLGRIFPNASNFQPLLVQWGPDVTTSRSSRLRRPRAKLGQRSHTWQAQQPNRKCRATSGKSLAPTFKVREAGDWQSEFSKVHWFLFWSASSLE